MAPYSVSDRRLSHYDWWSQDSRNWKLYHQRWSLYYQAFLGNYFGQIIYPKFYNDIYTCLTHICCTLFHLKIYLCSSLTTSYFLSTLLLLKKPRCDIMLKLRTSTSSQDEVKVTTLTFVPETAIKRIKYMKQ